jgi:hypothetical protein
MDSKFVAVLTAAFEAGLESRTSATATVRVGKRVTAEQAIESAVQSAWLWFWQKDADVSFAAVVAFARARCANVDPARVRAGFERRFKSGLSPA